MRGFLAARALPAPVLPALVLVDFLNTWISAMHDLCDSSKDTVMEYVCQHIVSLACSRRLPVVTGKPAKRAAGVALVFKDDGAPIRFNGRLVGMVGDLVKLVAEALSAELNGVVNIVCVKPMLPLSKLRAILSDTAMELVKARDDIVIMSLGLATPSIMMSNDNFRKEELRFLLGGVTDGELAMAGDALVITLGIEYVNASTSCKTMNLEQPSAVTWNMAESLRMDSLPLCTLHGDAIVDVCGRARCSLKDVDDLQWAKSRQLRHLTPLRYAPY